ncbi:MAG: glycoside hydrolase family 65 protein, partial [Bacteroidota bacterium]
MKNTPFVKISFILLFSLWAFAGFTQEANLKDSPWHIVADDINPNDYYGVTIGNGMIGIISAPQPNKISEVVLNGVYDTYGRGRVSNIMKTFEFMNLDVRIDGLDFLSYDYEDFTQTVDMKHGQLITEITIPGKAKVKTRMLAVRHLPFNAMTIVEVEALDDIEVKPYSIIESPDMLRDVHAYFNV